MRELGQEALISLKPRGPVQAVMPRPRASQWAVLHFLLGSLTVEGLTATTATQPL